MSSQAWHYTLPNGVSGTLVGEGLEEEQDAIECIAIQHGVEREQVRVRRAGEWDEHTKHNGNLL